MSEFKVGEGMIHRGEFKLGDNFIDGLVPHKYRDVIIAWANGAEVQYHSNVLGWCDSSRPDFHEGLEWRVKPESDKADEEFKKSRVLQLKSELALLGDGL